MGDLLVHPHRGVGPVFFGMTREEVRSTLAASHREFSRGLREEMDTDAFDELGVFVSYGVDGTCEAIEVVAPSNAIMNGMRLVGTSFSIVLGRFREWDSALSIDDAGATSIDLGVGVYAPSAGKDPGKPVESAIVFRSGYYD
jgi:hypothetical protein